MKSRGFNSDFGPKIMKRRNPLQPMLTVEAYDSMLEEIEKQFPQTWNLLKLRKRVREIVMTVDMFEVIGPS